MRLKVKTKPYTMINPMSKAIKTKLEFYLCKCREDVLSCKENKARICTSHFCVLLVHGAHNNMTPVITDQITHTRYFHYYKKIFFKSHLVIARLYSINWIALADRQNGGDVEHFDKSWMANGQFGINSDWNTWNSE